MGVILIYRVRPRMDSTLWYYWYNISMVARAGRYYGTPFKGHQGFTQGVPLSPTIFNMVVDAVISHRVTLVAGG